MIWLLIALVTLALLVFSVSVRRLFKRAAWALLVTVCTGTAVGILAAIALGWDGLLVAFAVSLVILPTALFARLSEPTESRAELSRRDANYNGLPRRDPPHDIAFSSIPVKRRRWFGRPNPEATLNVAWEAAIAHAGFAENRIQVARRSCSEFLRRTGENSLDPPVIAWAVFIRKRIPNLVNTCFADCRDRPGEQRRLLEALVTGMEEVAAEAERLMARSISQSGTEFERELHYVSLRVRQTSDPWS